MIVKVADLSDEVRRLSFSEQPAVLNAVLAESPNAAEQRFERPIDVTAEIYRHGSDVFLVGRLEGKVNAICCRCAEDICADIERSFKFLLVKAGAAGAQTPEDDRGLDHYDGDEIDITPLVVEEALLALDAAPICSPDCKGLCAGCGANLNSESCSCS